LSVDTARKWLEEVDSYVTHKETRRPRQFNPYFIWNRRVLVQADTFDVKELQKENDGVKHIMLLIDVFSRRLWLFPMRNMTAPNSVRIVENWLQSLDQPPAALGTDAGTEFTNQRMKDMLERYDVEWQLAHGTSKAAYAERANKSIQILIYKYMNENETFRYIDHLQDFADTYNNREHRGIDNLTPMEADDPDNSEAVRAILESKVKLIKKRKPKLAVGDMVKVKVDAKRPDPASRSYKQRTKDEFFVVTRVSGPRMPVPMYKIRSDDTGDDIVGWWYGSELSKFSGDTFKISRILDERTRNGRREVLVEYKGYKNPAKREWILRSALVLPGQQVYE